MNRHTLLIAGLTLFVAAVLGCNSPSSPPPASNYTDADLERDIADTVALQQIVSARLAEENLPPPISTSIQRPKPDEAIITIEYGDPKQKKLLMPKKRDGKWVIVSAATADP